MDIMEFGKTVLAIFGAISVLGGGFAVIHKWISPAIKMNKRVEILEEHDRRDYDVMKKYAERDSLILEVLLTMLDSQIACRLPRYLTKPRQRRSEWDMAGSDGISRVSAVFRGKSLLTNKMRII